MRPYQENEHILIWDNPITGSACRAHGTLRARHEQIRPYPGVPRLPLDIVEFMTVARAIGADPVVLLSALTF